MTSAIVNQGRRVFAAVLLALLAVGAAAKPKYLHTAVGSYDVVSAMSEKDTRNLVVELMEIRQAIKDITGSQVIFEPNTQILVFGSQKEMDEFFPVHEAGYGYHYSIKWAYNTSKAGDVIALVGDQLGKSRYREGGYQAFSRYLLARMVPECPPWIYDGLSEYLCTVRHKDGMLKWGSEPQREPGLARAKADTLFTTRTWEHNANNRGVWHYWLTDTNPATRHKVRSFFAALRHGEPSNAETVSEVFGVPGDVLQQEVTKHVRRLATKVVQEPATTGDLATRLEVKPASADEILSARQMLAASIKGAPYRFYEGLGKFAADYPNSPKPFEALARRAIEERDEYRAAEHWKQARDRGTRNPYAYLSLVRERIAGRIGQLDLPPLMPELTENMRETVDHCIACNAGELEAYFWMAWIEALASDPQEARLRRIDASGARFLYPGVYIPTASAYLKIGRSEDARTLLLEYLKAFGSRGSNMQAANALLKKIGSGD